MLHRGGPRLAVQGAWFCVCCVLACSSVLHAHLHFDQGVLGRLGTDCPLRARPTIRAGLHDKDR
jgi:hypothetical protein